MYTSNTQPVHRWRWAMGSWAGGGASIVNNTVYMAGDYSMRAVDSMTGWSLLLCEPNRCRLHPVRPCIGSRRRIRFRIGVVCDARCAWLGLQHAVDSSTGQPPLYCICIVLYCIVFISFILYGEMHTLIQHVAAFHSDVLSFGFKSSRYQGLGQP